MRLGFAGIYVGAERGGSGLGRLEASLIFESLSQGCVSTAAYISIHNMVTWMIDKYGNEGQHKRYLSDLLCMNRLGSYCLTEPGAGSDAAALQTTAKLDGDHYILNGTKSFISGAGSSEIYLVLAKTASGGEASKEISCFIVEKDFAGVSFGKKESKMGWNSQPTRMVILEDCRVPKDNLLGRLNEGFGLAINGLVGGRINIASCSLGAAQACLEQAVTYSTERRLFNKHLSDFQHTQFKLADLASNLVASRLMVRNAATILDSGAPTALLASSMAKRFATDRCFDICNGVLQIFGGYGYLKDYPIEQYVRDSRVHQILEGTNEVMLLITARNLYSMLAQKKIDV